MESFLVDKEIKSIQNDSFQNITNQISSKVKIHTENFSKVLNEIKNDPLRTAEILKDSIKNIEKGDIWEVPNFFLQSECDIFIKLTEEMGYEDATKIANVQNGSVLRDMKRLLISDSQTSDILTFKMKDLVPLAYEGGLFKGVNGSFKFYKYEKNNKYDRHIDGEFENEILKIKSVASFIIYLNSPSKGGHTRFYSHKFNNGLHDVKPEVGKLLIYRQKGWLHQGMPVETDQKYIIRGDLMYSWLDNKEIDYLKNMKCALCSKELDVMDLFSCEHKLVYCGCNQFFNNEELIDAENSPKVGQCKLCKKKYEFENKKLFNFFDKKSKCDIY